MKSRAFLLFPIFLLSVDFCSSFLHLCFAHLKVGFFVPFMLLWKWSMMSMLCLIVKIENYGFDRLWTVTTPSSPPFTTSFFALPSVALFCAASVLLTPLYKFSWSKVVTCVSTLVRCKGTITRAHSNSMFLPLVLNNFTANFACSLQIL